jgi:hypothetical protein
MGDWWIFLKTSAPLSLIKTFGINILSPRSISLNSTFNVGTLLSCAYDGKSRYGE